MKIAKTYAMTGREFFTEKISRRRRKIVANRNWEILWKKEYSPIFLIALRLCELMNVKTNGRTANDVI